MEELEAIRELGIATSKEVRDLIRKSWQSTIRQLNNLEKFGFVRVVSLQSSDGTKRIYIEEEIYEEIIEDEIY